MVLLPCCQCCDSSDQRCNNPCSVLGHNAGYLLNDQLAEGFFQLGDTVESLDLQVNGNRRYPILVSFINNRQIRGSGNEVFVNLSAFTVGATNAQDPCGYIRGTVACETTIAGERVALVFEFNSLPSKFGFTPESASISLYGFSENLGFYGNFLYLNEATFGGISWTNTNPTPPALLDQTITTFHDSTWCDAKSRANEELVEVPIIDDDGNLLFVGPIVGNYSVYKADGTFVRTDAFYFDWPELISVHACPEC